MKHGSLFSGIGGFDLAAEWMGWDNVFHCENVKSKREFLKQRFKYSISYEDVTTTNFNIHKGSVDVLSGGFPCQDASKAKQHGKSQQGLQGERTGLFYSMVRSIDETRPKYVVAENVTNILKTNGGKDFREILTRLAGMGYDAEWRVCYASEVGAPHKRSRLYLVAYSNSIGKQSATSFFSNVQAEVTPFTWGAIGTTVQIVRGGAWQSEPPVLCVGDGVSSKLVREHLHGYGNAVVPQIPYQIFKAIEQFEINEAQSKGR